MQFGGSDWLEDMPFFYFISISLCLSLGLFFFFFFFTLRKSSVSMAEFPNRHIRLETTATIDP